MRDGLLLCHTCGKEIIQGQGHASEILSDDHFDCDKCDKQFPDIESLYQHKAKDHGMSYQCDVCKELEAREATGIGYICCVCDVEFEIATELEDHMSRHNNHSRTQSPTYARCDEGLWPNPKPETIKTW